MRFLTSSDDDDDSEESVGFHEFSGDEQAPPQAMLLYDPRGRVISTAKPKPRIGYALSK